MSLTGWPVLVGWVSGMWYVVRPLGVHLARRAAAQAAIGQTERRRLTLVFAALGANRVAAGLAATGHGWKDCFLAIAMGGAPGALQGARHAFLEGPNLRVLATRIGTSPRVLRDVVRAWDGDEAGFRALATEWLAQHEAVAPPCATRRAAAPLTLAQRT